MAMVERNSKSVLVGMSGGIDSTAVCSMLLAAGYRVCGLTLVTRDASLKAAAAAGLISKAVISPAENTPDWTIPPAMAEAILPAPINKSLLIRNDLSYNNVIS